MITKIAGGFFPKFQVFPIPRSVAPTDHQNIQKSVQNLRFYVLHGLPGVPEKGVGSKHTKIIEIIDLFKKNLQQKIRRLLFEISGISTPRSVAPADHQKHTKVCTKLKIRTSRLPKTYKSLYKT